MGIIQAMTDKIKGNKKEKERLAKIVETTENFLNLRHELPT